jgi:tetratricopeptide (TPR) repeat protein
VADKDDKKTPGFDPKPMQVGGESILDRLLPHMKKIVIAILITAGVLGVIFFVVWLKDRKAQKATDKLAEVIDVAQRPVRVAGEPPEATAKKDKEPPFADTKERANAVLDVMSKQGTDLAGSSYKAANMLQAGKLDDAIAEFKKGSDQQGIEGVLAKEGLGIAQEMKAEAEKDAAARQKGLEEALATFQAMQPDDKGLRRAYALYHQGRVLGLLGKKADAKATLEKAKAASDKDSMLADLISMRLATIGS